MDKKEKLMLHLTNLKSQGHTSATLNIDLVLDCLKNVTADKIQQSKEPTTVYVDGGSF